MSSTLGRLIKGGSLRSITLIFNIIIAFMMMPFVIQHLGDRWYGLWIIVGSLIGYYGYLDFGLSSACQRFIAKALHDEDNPGDINTVISSALCLFLGLSIIAILITVLTVSVAPLFVSSEEELSTFKIVFIILGIKTAIMFPFMVFNGIITGYLRYDISSYIEFAKLLLRTILIIIYLTMGYSIISLAVITLITEVGGYIALALWSKKIHPSMKFSRKFIDYSLFKQLLNYGKFSFLASLGDILRFKIDDLVVARFIGLSMVTHYAIAIRLIDYVGQLLQTVLGMFMPVFTKYISQNEEEVLKEKFLIVTEISTFLTLLIVPALMVVGESFISLWMGKEYIDAYIPLIILSSAFIMDGCNRICVVMLYAKAKHDYYAKINMVEGVANITLSLLLVQEYGIIGVAIGTAIPTIFIKAVLLPRFSCDLLGIPLLVYYKLLFKHLFMALFFYACYFYVHDAISISNYFTLVFMVCAFSSVYIVISLLLFEKPLKKHIKELVPQSFHSYTNWLLK